MRKVFFRNFIIFVLTLALVYMVIGGLFLILLVLIKNPSSFGSSSLYNVLNVLVVVSTISFVYWILPFTSNLDERGLRVSILDRKIPWRSVEK